MENFVGLFLTLFFKDFAWLLFFGGLFSLSRICKGFAWCCCVVMVLMMMRCELPSV